MAETAYKSDAFASIHETAEALRDIGAIDKRTMREFDAACLAPLPNYTGRQIRRIRERENVSQPVFALYLAVSKNLVSDRERGIKKPAGPPRRLLSIVEKRGLAGAMLLALRPVMSTAELCDARIFRVRSARSNSNVASTDCLREGA